MKINDGGPAFPQTPSFLNGERVWPNEYGYEGLSKREWFAAHAPAPSKAQMEHEANKDRIANPHGDPNRPQRRSVQEVIADLAVAYADQMLAALAREPR